MLRAKPSHRLRTWPAAQPYLLTRGYVKVLGMEVSTDGGDLKVVHSVESQTVTVTSAWLGLVPRSPVKYTWLLSRCPLAMV